MKRELIDRTIRRVFQEHLVGFGWTLRKIRELFDKHGVKEFALPEAQLPNGERRSLVECYYASIDWGKPQDARRILDVYEDVLTEISLGISPEEKEEKDKLIRYLENHGYIYDGGQIVSQMLDAALVEAIPTVNLDTDHLHIYIDRINSSIDADPSLAIGSTKELIEATIKTILNGCGVEYDDKNDDISKLLKKVQKALELAPDGIDGSKKGAGAIKKLLNNLGSVAIGVAELRNLYGSGHGKGQKPQGITSRHARLVVGSGITLCTFLLETYEYRNDSNNLQR